VFVTKAAMAETEVKTAARELKNICVFCGSQPGKDEAYAEAATTLGKHMAANGIGLVYGGGTVGLMGIIARTVDAEGGPVLGVIPRALSKREISGEGVGTVVEVDDMHTRKAKMAEAADAFIAMPGGFGTFEELFEVITWQQLGIHSKPIGCLSVNGYYEPLGALIAHAVKSGFIHERFLDLVVIDADPANLVKRLQEQRLPEAVITWEVPAV